MPVGVMLIGEPYWRREPPDQTTVAGCYAVRYQREYLGWGVFALMGR